MTEVLLPGDCIPPGLLPVPSKQKTLTLGPGLAFQPPTTIKATAAGLLNVDHKRNALWLEASSGGRYVPATGDLVIATVHHSSIDFYHCAMSPYTTLATLPQLSFEGASRKTRPVLQHGSLVYARVASASKHMEPELECVHPTTGKSDGLGELKGGTVFDVSPGMARRMMMNKTREDGGVAVLEELADKGLRFEIAVGRNGRVWVNSDNFKTTIVIGRALQETDANSLTVEQQEKLIKTLLKST